MHCKRIEIADGLAIGYEPVVAMRAVARLAAAVRSTLSHAIAIRAEGAVSLGNYRLDAARTVAAETKAGAADTFVSQPSDIIVLPLTR